MSLPQRAPDSWFYSERDGTQKRVGRGAKFRITACLGLLRGNVRGILRALQFSLSARVVKLVDTGDLKSPDRLGRAGSSPAPGAT